MLEARCLGQSGSLASKFGPSTPAAQWPTTILFRQGRFSIGTFLVLLLQAEPAGVFEPN